MPVFS